MIDQKAAARLKYIFEEWRVSVKGKKGSQVEFAAITGVSQASINKMMNGNQPITLDVLKNITLKLKYDPMWIITGTGSPKLKEDKSKLITDFKNIRVENLILNARLTAIEKQQSNETKSTHR